MWAFEATGAGEPAAQDALDTALGIAQSDITLKVEVVFTQVN